ncbi:MAG: hypothetical protein GF384_08625 [Elusimicrobia bacterium]|nr:hypothetical protein [Elusimicrobiota bacterium]MBD3412680.1 hypothetical protein [Elusimicrobiota bacterium]
MGVLKFLCAVALLPAAWGVLAAFLKTLSLFNYLTADHKYFLWGLLTYPIFQVVFFQPLRTYVFGHELTHALASMMMGGKVRRFKVTRSGGSVSLSKTNFIVSLAPYFVPLYTLVLIGVYFSVTLFYPLDSFYRYFLFLVGFSLSFHAALTIFAAKQRQPDITKTGIVFSLVFISMVSPIMWVLVLKSLFYAHVDLSGFFVNWYTTAAKSYGFILDSLLNLLRQS